MQTEGPIYTDVDMTGFQPTRRLPHIPGLVMTLGIVLFSAAMNTVADRAEPALVLVLSEQRSPYTDVARVFEQNLPATGTPESLRLEYVEPADLDAGDPRIERASAVVGFGTRALRRLATLDTSTPILSTLVPRVAFEGLTGPPGQSRTSIRAIHLDQPLHRQMALIRLLFPENPSTVAVLLGPSSREQESRIRESGREQDLNIRTAIVGPDEHETPTGALSTLLSEADVLLAIPDPAVYNRVSIRSLLLMTFRHRIPVIGYSDSFVNAGAVAAVVTPIEAIGRESADMVIRGKQNGVINLPASRYPNSFRVRVNRNVAETLEIQLPTAESLENEIRRNEVER